MVENGSNNSILNACMKPFTVQNLIDEINQDKIKRIVVMTGAGISTASGIPDFRSSHTGLYNNLNQYQIPYPEAIFEKNYFKRNPIPFFKLARELMPNIEKYRPNKIHYFIRLLQDKKLLHRLYTQNIDGLECLTGIESKKLVEAHGSFRSAHCIKCECLYSGKYVKNEIESNRVPICVKHQCNGVVKPDITFFGENLPQNFYELHESDFLLADFILVMGTSLQVEPFANIIKKSRSNVPRLLLNKESVGPFKLIKLKNSLTKDLQILGDLTQCVDFLVDKLGWKDELNELIQRETKNLESMMKVKENILDKIFYIDLSRTLSRLDKTRPFSRATSKSRIDLNKNSNLIDLKLISLNESNKTSFSKKNFFNFYETCSNSSGASYQRKTSNLKKDSRVKSAKSKKSLVLNKMTKKQVYKKEKEDDDNESDTTESDETLTDGDDDLDSEDDEDPNKFRKNIKRPQLNWKTTSQFTNFKAISYSQPSHDLKLQQHQQPNFFHHPQSTNLFTANSKPAFVNSNKANIFKNNLKDEENIIISNLNKLNINNGNNNNNSNNNNKSFSTNNTTSIALELHK